MKKILAIITVAAITAMAGTAMAADTNTLTVTASVSASCAFSDPTSSLTFGALDPAIGSNRTASSSTQFWCTKGTGAVTIAAGTGMNPTATDKRQMIDSVSGDLIEYDLILEPDLNSNNGPLSPRTLTINGEVLGDDYKDKTAGSYADTVLLTITP
jgi:spore coat protein U-like protein